MVLLFHWWTMFSPFNLVAFVVTGDTGHWQCCCLVHRFFWSLLKVVHHYFVGFRAIFSAWSKERSDHMVALMMLNSTKNQTIWYGAKMPGRTLWIKPVAVYILSSTLMSAYGMWKASMSNFTFPRVARIKQKWMAIWIHNFKKWICKFEKNEYQVPASCYVVPRIWFSSQRSYPQIDSLRWKTRSTIYPL